MYANYEIWDYYEDFGIVGHYETLDEVKEAKTDWEEDTNGKCELEIRKWNNAVRLCIPIEID